MGHSRKKLELTGQHYGHLTVLGPAENIGTRTAWHCRCDCGRETVVRTNRLRSGHTTSCGCLGPGAGLMSLTYIDGTCVEMLRAKTVRKNNTRGSLGWIGGRPSSVGGPPSASRASAITWAATPALRMPSKPASGEKNGSTTSLSVNLPRLRQRRGPRFIQNLQ